MSVKIILGDVLESKVDGNKIIAHCCNDVISFGSGIAGSIARKWPHVREAYMSWGYASKIKDYPGKPFVLGQIQFVKAEPSIIVCNMIGQRDIGGFTIDGIEVPPVRYESLRECFLRLREAMRSTQKTTGELPQLCLPMLGAGLAKGRWQQIYWIIREVFDDSFNITIYAFDNTNLALANDAHNNYDALKRSQWLKH